MDNVIVIYVIVQLLTTAFGLAVIGSVKDLVYDKLHSEGYVRRNRNSLYNFSEGITNTLKGFIPFYYFTKSLSLIGNKKAVDIKYADEINSGNYVKRNEIKNDILVIEDKDKEKDNIKINSESEIIFEKPEKYKARKTDYSVYNTYETPIEYITREANYDNKLEITPYNDNEKTVEHVLVKDEVNKSDIAKAISELSSEELEQLKEKLTILSEIKKKNVELKLEKDVA